MCDDMGLQDGMIQMRLETMEEVYCMVICCYVTTSAFVLRMTTTENIERNFYNYVPNCTQTDVCSYHVIDGLYHKYVYVYHRLVRSRVLLLYSLVLNCNCGTVLFAP